MTGKSVVGVVLSRPLFRIGLCSLLCLAVFAYVLHGTFQYVLPGEPGYDPATGRRVEWYGVALNILALPFLTLVYLLPGIPNAFPGPISMLSIAANSLLWGYGMSLLSRKLSVLVKGERSCTED